MQLWHERVAERWWRLAYVLAFPLIAVAVGLVIVALLAKAWLLAIFLAVWVVILLGEIASYRRRRNRLAG
jgi:hypothetical protein